MPVCYMNNNKYECQYEVKEDGIEVEVNYNIYEEIPIVNGIRSFGSNTEFQKRNLLIIDFKAKMNYFLMDAEACGYSMKWGTPDGGYYSRFYASYYFYDNDYKKLDELSEKTNIKKIKIYSKFINELIGIKSLNRENNDDEFVIRLDRNSEKTKLEINKNNITSLTMSDSWKINENGKQMEINIKMNGYIEIELEECVQYEEVYTYILELIIYFQLLKTCKFKIDKIMVEIEKNYYCLSIPLEKFDYSNSNVKKSVETDISDFLLNCYEKISYRNSKNEMRNIPYIILKTSRGLEDNFLMFYRFIECYYKKQPIKGIKNNFLEYSIRNNYKKFVEIGEEKLEDFIREIISLRNHYTHEGYYIEDEKLDILYPKIDNKTNPKNHRIYNVDFDWIYQKTKVLYEIVIDIIFKNMLGYMEYKFEKHF